MSFVKLDCGMLDSTIWVDREARELFITALLMAKPKQVNEPIGQLAVRTLERTGFVVPPGWYGFISAAGPGIVRRAGMDLESGLSALERLGAPELDSRTPDFEGRRLVRVDGGYIALNYMQYRDKDHTAADRMRNWRKKNAKRGKTKAQVRAENDGREARYEDALARGDDKSADRIVSEGLPESNGD
jgi:hypothetical protein